jgi:hypothetical protein
MGVRVEGGAQGAAKGGGLMVSGGRERAAGDGGHTKTQRMGAASLESMRRSRPWPPGLIRRPPTWSYLVSMLTRRLTSPVRWLRPTPAGWGPEGGDGSCDSMIQGGAGTAQQSQFKSLPLFGLGVKIE